MQPLPNATQLGVGGKFPEVTLLVSIDTAPVRAGARPYSWVPALSVMLASARMLPLKTTPAARVAELPTCQNTFPAWAPLLTLTDELIAARSVLPIWKMNTALGLPC